jgi:hypothetical protein
LLSCILETMARSQVSEAPSPGSRAPAFAGIAAVGGVLAASSCCLPILPFAMAAGAAGGAAFLSAARPYLLAFSILLIAWGFYQSARAKKCRRPSRVATVLLWVSALFVFISIFFPEMMANAAADLLGR